MAISGVNFHGCGSSRAHAPRTIIPIHNRFGISIAGSPIAILLALTVHRHGLSERVAEDARSRSSESLSYFLHLVARNMQRAHAPPADRVSRNIEGGSKTQ